MSESVRTGLAISGIHFSMRWIGCSIKNMEQSLFFMELSIFRVHRSIPPMDQSTKFIGAS